MGSELVLFALKKIEKPFVELQKLKLFSKTYGWRLEPTNKWGEGVTLNLNLIATSQSVDLLVYLLESYDCELFKGCQVCAPIQVRDLETGSMLHNLPIDIGTATGFLLVAKTVSFFIGFTSFMIDEAADRYSSMAKALSASWIEAPYVLQRYVWLKIN
ncbi:hypothetical protein V6N13_129639 [Hibiscus sabdariffa]